MIRPDEQHTSGTFTGGEFYHLIDLKDENITCSIVNIVALNRRRDLQVSFTSTILSEKVKIINFFFLSNKSSFTYSPVTYSAISELLTHFNIRSKHLDDFEKRF